MKWCSARALLIVAAAVSGFGEGAAAAPAERSVSTSRQFIVYGPDTRLRGAVCDVAERTKKNALRLLRQSDGWATPILIDARAAQADRPEASPAHLNFSQTGFGFKIQLDLALGADLSGPAVEREILRAVLLERMYRDRADTPAGTPYVAPPDWLLEGMLALAHEDDATAASRSLGTVIVANRVLSFHDFLRQQPGLLDSPSRALYRGYSAAMLSMLLDSTAGASGLQRFVASLPEASNDSVADLKAAFPNLRVTDEEIEKRWTLAVTRFAGRQQYRMLGCEETERQLAQVLRVEVHSAGKPPTVYALDDFPKFLPLAGVKRGLQRLTQDLLLLSGRANPLYRPVIEEYQRITALLERKKTRKISERLADLRETRETISRRMSAIDDYMNWFEATQAQVTSGAFGEYMKAAELAARREPRRRDPISVYLDAMEAQLPN